METVRNFIFLGSKITADGDCSHEIRRHLLLGKKAMTSHSFNMFWQHIKKQRHYYANKGPSGQSYGFSCGHVWMWELDYKESWALKIWCFWTVVLEKLLRVPWTARRSNQSILKEISPRCLLEGLTLKLKLWYFGHLMWRTASFEKTLILQMIEGWRRRGRQRMRWLEASPTQWTWVWVDSSSWWWTGRPGVLWFMGSQRVGHDWVSELNWTELNHRKIKEWECNHFIQEKWGGKNRNRENSKNRKKETEINTKFSDKLRSG